MATSLKIEWSEPEQQPGEPPWWMTEFAARFWKMGYDAAVANASASADRPSSAVNLDPSDDKREE